MYWLCFYCWQKVAMKAQNKATKVAATTLNTAISEVILRITEVGLVQLNTILKYTLGHRKLCAQSCKANDWVN